MTPNKKTISKVKIMLKRKEAILKRREKNNRNNYSIDKNHQRNKGHGYN